MFSQNLPNYVYALLQHENVPRTSYELDLNLFFRYMLFTFHSALCKTYDLSILILSLVNFTPFQFYLKN